MPPTAFSGHYNDDIGYNTLLFLDHQSLHHCFASALIMTSIYLDFYQVDGLHEPGVGCQSAGVQHTSRRGDDLTTTAVNSVSVQGHVVDVEADASHVLLAHHTL